MGLGEVIGTLAGEGSLNLTGLPPELISKLGSLITILKAAGIVFIAYIVFLVLRWFFTLKRYRITKKMNIKINEIDRKLDILLKDKKIRLKSVIEKKPSNKKDIKKKTKNIKKLIKKIKKKKKL
tara:strand:+ start:512 stop:883 length:372 start_codon:yes stop_codon:yes gene_type:complete